MMGKQDQLDTSTMMLSLLNDQPEQYMQKQLESVLDGMPIAVSWANLEDASITFQNRKFKETFGYEFGEHSSVQDWIDETYINPDQLKRAVDSWTPHFLTKSIVPIEIPQVEVDVLCKDGSIKTCLHSGMILPKHGWALAIFNDISERKKYEEKIQKLALEDDLTKIPNRRAFNKALKKNLSYSRRHRTHTALLLIDLDNFKGLNDTLGHDVGDLALKKAAEILQNSIRDEDVACRLGGDEFAVILNMGNGRHDAVEVSERILKGFSEQFDLGGNKVDVNISIGIAECPKNGLDSLSIFKTADEALYRAKAKGKGQWSK